DPPTEEVAPMRLPARRLRPGDLGSGPVAFGRAVPGKARRRDDDCVLLVGTSKSADLVGSGADGDERLISPLCKQLRMIAAVGQQGCNDGQSDATVATIFPHLEHRRVAVSLQCRRELFDQLDASSVTARAPV